MDNFVTIKTFTYPHELSVIRGRLEAEGIECFAKDELTTQVYPFYSNAIGGVKLQVRESDFERATEILKESGDLQEDTYQPPEFYVKLDDATSGLPIVKKLPLEFRLLTIAGLVALLVISIVFLVRLPGTYDKLTQNFWCVDYIMYQGQYYEPNSRKMTIEGADFFCNESIDFKKNGAIGLPGFNSFEANGNWKLISGQLLVSGADTFDFVYNGRYKISFSGTMLTLKSEKTTIHCLCRNFDSGFQ